jgi:hypothetical protein
MDVQKFTCTKDMTAYGFYRKLVYKVSSMDVED